MSMTGKQVAAANREVAEVQEILQADWSKAKKIRALHAMGYSNSAIANLMGIIYQHVRNVLNTPVKG